MMRSTQILELQFEPFQYEPLPTPTSIRLLSLVKQRKNGPTVCGKPLPECTIRTVDLKESPAFKALSYCWGNPLGEPQDRDQDRYSLKHKWPIALNGKIVFTQRNLYEALEQFTKPCVPDDATKLDAKSGPYNKTSLISAAESGRLSDVIEFLQKGADIHAQDRFGETALHYAAENGHLEIVKILVQHGAKLDMLDSTARTPLACCLQRKRGQHEHVAQVLRNPPMNLKDEQYEFVTDEYWVDALCINQADVRERNAQVALMADIYKTAVSVKVWLGIESAETELISGFLQSPAEKLLNGPISPVEVDALAVFSSRAWFRRKWVIQEVALAKTIEMVCGKYQLFANAYTFYHLRNNSALRDMLSLRAQQGERVKRIGFTALMELGYWLSIMKPYGGGKNEQTPPPSLVWLIAHTWQFESSDHRDRIFALLGMTCEASKELGGHKTMVADYTRSTGDVFLEAGRIFIEARGDNKAYQNQLEPLEGLGFVQYPREEMHHKLGETCRYNFDRVDGVPTWVPHFHLPLATPAFWDKRFSACGGRYSTCEIWDSERSILKVSAYKFDHITKLARNTMDGIGGSEYVDVTGWLEMTSCLDLQYHGICSRVEALWKALSVDFFQGDEQIQLGKSTFKQSICEVWPTVKDPRYALELLDLLRGNEHSDLLPSGQELEASKRKKIHHDWDNDPLGFHRHYGAYHLTRDLIRTQRGYLGLASYSAREGDEIWILKGGRVPYILRPTRDETGMTRYEYICDSFVYGIMSGEAMQDRSVKFSPIEIE